jgi:hypothetical protein
MVLHVTRTFTEDACVEAALMDVAEDDTSTEALACSVDGSLVSVTEACIKSFAEPSSVAALEALIALPWTST